MRFRLFFEFLKTGDPLGGCDVTPAGYGQMLHQLNSLANGKIIVVLEGGYNLRSIAASTVACLNVLVGGSPPRTENTTTGASKAAMKSITSTILAHRTIAQASWACSFPMLGGEEEEEEEETLNQPIQESAEELGKKMHMRAMFERMRAKREARKKKEKESKKATEGKTATTTTTQDAVDEGKTSLNTEGGLSC